MNKLTINTLILILLLVLVDFPSWVSAECTCDPEEDGKRDRKTALRLKIGALTSILVFSAIGVSLPVLAKSIPAFIKPENDFFYLIKSFAAGVILATGFIHILPDAFDNLTSPCLKDNPWGKFAFTGFVAMMTAIGTLMVDSFAGYYMRLHFNKSLRISGNEEQSGEHDGHVHVHTHATHGHAHGSSFVSNDLGSADLIRHRVISQVLELGIIVNSVIIGIALGASSNPSEVKTSLIALSFHQLFEGMGLGGCISQSNVTHISRGVDNLCNFVQLIHANHANVKHVFRGRQPMQPGAVHANVMHVSRSGQSMQTSCTYLEGTTHAYPLQTIDSMQTPCTYLEAKFKAKSVIVMALFFALTTPIGVAIGIGITSKYDENSSTALIVEGILNAASSGILIYMSLVDLLATDFMSERMQNNGRLQLGAYVSLLIGAGCMSVLAYWA
ncbi:hypothetical protein Syun_010520 [Stephania yunnanensis]|uniref:Uncharacterized protein n=1 Tax=Stephania yunnanensis TaxID=152371 RepID=A0AAP0KGL6_9MAGN